MDAGIQTRSAPFRDARFAPARLEVERRADGAIVLFNPTPFPDAFQTANAPLGHWAAVAPDRVWLAERSGEGWRTVTFAEGLARIAALAGGLRDLGVAGRGPMLVLARNNIDHALIAYAAMGQGVAVAPVSPQYGLAGANLARLTHAGEAIGPGSVYAEDAALFAHGLSAPILDGLPVIAGANPRPGDAPLERLYRASPAPPVARPDDLAKLLLTSGSTGHPKAVMITHHRLAITAAQVAACFEDPEPPVMVNSAPWSHSLGANAILHQAAHRGGTLYIDAGQPAPGRFAETVRNLREISPTYQNMLPAGWMLFADELERDEALARRFFERVRLLQYGGAALGQAVADRIQAVAVRIAGQRICFSSGYGATETGPTACNVHWPNDRMGLIGLPLPGTTVKLVPTAGKLEFRVKGPQVTTGYYRQPEASAASFDEEGFYVLGDAARFVDPADPARGMVFDGRLSENFKLASGAFVNVGELRIGAISAIGGAVTDAVVCGEGEDAVGLLLYPNPSLAPAQVEARVRAGLLGFNAGARGDGGRVARALVLPDGPDAAAGEVTDKGYIAQALARRLRAEAVARLFADPPVTGVILP